MRGKESAGERYRTLRLAFGSGPAAPRASHWSEGVATRQGHKTRNNSDFHKYPTIKACLA